MARKPNRHERRAQPAAPKSLKILHVRANDYREYYGDGLSVRIEGQHVILGIFINDTQVSSETMELIEDIPGVHANYKPVLVEEKRVRTDFCSIRVPIAAFQEAIGLFLARLDALIEQSNSNPE